MGNFQGTDIFIQPAEVLATYEEDRLIDIKWIGMEGTRRSIVVVNNPGNTSMPQPGDRGLVIGTGNHFYFIGKIEYDYRSKVEGKYVNKDTGKKTSAKQVEGGEVYITNTKAKSWLGLINNGDMSLLNGFMEGFKYLANLRLPQLIGKTVSLAGNGIKFAIGTTVRDIPGVGPQPVVGANGGKALEALLQVAYMGIQTVKLHLGDVTDLTTGLIPELSSWGARLKAVLEVTASVVTLGSLKIDELGNVQIKSTTGQVSIEGIPVAGILLGGILSSTHPAVWGDTLMTYLASDFLWKSTHVHGAPGTPPVAKPPIVPVAMISPQVFVS